MNLRLPVEVNREIFRYLLLQHSYADNFFGHDDEKRCRYLSQKHCLYPNQTMLRYFRYGEDGKCICWQLDILSVSMVCRTWYHICADLLKNQKAQPWLHLLNLPSFRRTYPFRPRLIQLLKESYYTNSCIRKQIKNLVIDFKSFDSKKDQTLALFELCPSIERLNIVYDSSFQNSSIFCKSQLLCDTLVKHNLAHRIKQLCFTSHPSLYDCPCCAGKEWDHHLYPLIDSLTSLETLVLDNVLPSREVYERLSQNSNLTRIVFHRAILPIPQRHGEMLFVNNIPNQLWQQIKVIEVYENAEGEPIWRNGQYLNELVKHTGPQLERFVLKFNIEDEESLF